MKDEHNLTEAQLAVLVGPRTHEVLDAFLEHGELSATQVQTMLGFESKSAYYQVGKLRKAGLLLPVEGDQRAKTFRPVAKRIRMPEGFQGERYERLAAKAVSAKLRRASRRFEAVAARSGQSPELVGWLYLGTATLTLSKAAFEELTTKIAKLLQDAANSKPEPGTRKLRLLLVSTPDLDD
ncbi:MAG: hypothetical protein HONBIEJF_01503 [Fimbriimonadaceae bacterium]|nr:hypothetical protein [Fimbriimonadaceae bacterium]